MYKRIFLFLLTAFICASAAACSTESDSSVSEISQKESVASDVQSSTSSSDNSVSEKSTEESSSESIPESSSKESKTESEPKEDPESAHESEIQAAETKYQNLKNEQKLLLDYCKDNYPDIFESQTISWSFSSPNYFIFDMDQDDHLEMFVNPSRYSAGSDIRDTEICWIEDGIIHNNTIPKKFEAGYGHYDLLLQPETLNGTVTGIKSFEYFLYGQGFYNLQPGDSTTYVIYSFEDNDLKEKHSVENEYVDGVTWKHSIDSNSVSESEAKSFFKENYGLILNNGINLYSIPENGNNFLMSKSGYYDEYLFYDSDTRLLTNADLEAMLLRNNCTDKETKKLYLELARNEMAARYGYKFSSSDFVNHFQQLDWYNKINFDYYSDYCGEHKNSSGQYESPLNGVERANNDLIEKYETDHEL